MDFYRAILERYPGRCLELGAGDGRIAAGLSDLSHVVALEPSAAMLTQWPGEERRDVSIVRAAAQEPPFNRGSFRLVLFPYNGLHCILDRNARKLVLREAAQLLGDDGLFFIETCPQFGSRHSEESVVRYSYAKNGKSLRLTESVSHAYDDPDRRLGRIRFDMTYTGTVAPGGRVDITLELALIPAGQLLEDMRDSGMSIMSVWGDYDMSPWDGESSPRLLVMAGRDTR